MRNGIYTYYKGYHLEIHTIRDDDEKVILNYKGERSPFKDFDKSRLEKNTFCRVIKKSDLKNAYAVTTYGLYRGVKVKVFQVAFAHDMIVRIATSDKNALNQLDMKEVNKGWYIKDIEKNELEKIWEEGTSIWDLPMPPSGLESQN